MKSIVQPSGPGALSFAHDFRQLRTSCFSKLESRWFEKLMVIPRPLMEEVGGGGQSSTMVFILGFGNIGIHLAKRLRPFDVKILATKRSWGRLAQDSSKSEAPPVENDCYADLVDERGSHADILKFASKADIVVCCLAMNSETAGIVNNDFISVMRKVCLLAFLF
ncbi:putative CCA tRNA nucleotidyltransferase 2-like [Capsicum annuum]|nr:putative CCA tRNA nucleotidyltransferase 2-like [Capsicum annuum]